MVGPLGRTVELEANADAKRLALDEGVVEEESELFFSGGKYDWQKVLGDNFGHRPKRGSTSLAGSDFVANALEKRGFGIFYCFGTNFVRMDERRS